MVCRILRGENECVFLGMLLRQIEELETLAKKVLKLLKSLPLNDIRIDNTKK